MSDLLTGVLSETGLNSLPNAVTTFVPSNILHDNVVAYLNAQIDRLMMVKSRVCRTSMKDYSHIQADMHQPCEEGNAT